MTQSKTGQVKIRNETQQRPTSATSQHCQDMHTDFWAKTKSNFSLTTAECTSKAIFQWYISCRCLPGSKQTQRNLFITGGRICFVDKSCVWMYVWLQPSESSCEQRGLDSSQPALRLRLYDFSYYKWTQGRRDSETMEQCSSLSHWVTTFPWACANFIFTFTFVFDFVAKITTDKPPAL